MKHPVNKEMLTKQLNEGFKFLEEKEKLALLLKYFEELTDAEICEVLEVTPFDCGILLHSAKTKMRSFTAIFDDIDELYGKGRQFQN